MTTATTEPPRRIRLDLQTPAEAAIRAARDAVELVGADVRLTHAVIALGVALDQVADYIDGVDSPARSIVLGTLPPERPAPTLRDRIEDAMLQVLEGSDGGNRIMAAQVLLGMVAEPEPNPFRLEEANLTEAQAMLLDDPGKARALAKRAGFATPLEAITAAARIEAVRPRCPQCHQYVPHVPR